MVSVVEMYLSRAVGINAKAEIPLAAGVVGKVSVNAPSVADPLLSTAVGIMESLHLWVVMFRTWRRVMPRLR